jgi:hypothetical protein
VVNSMLRPYFTPRKDPASSVQEAGWAPGPVWTGAENLASTGIRSPDRPARKPVAIPSELPGPHVLFMACGNSAVLIRHYILYVLLFHIFYSAMIHARTHARTRARTHTHTHHTHTHTHTHTHALPITSHTVHILSAT